MSTDAEGMLVSLHEASRRIEALTDERDEARGDYEQANEVIHEANAACAAAMPGWSPLDGHPCEGIGALVHRLEEVGAERDALRAALKRYGHHEEVSGGRFVCSGSKCYCGLDAALGRDK